MIDMMEGGAMNRLKCPQCQSKNAIFVGNSQGYCNDCGYNFDDLSDLPPGTFAGLLEVVSDEQKGAIGDDLLVARLLWVKAQTSLKESNAERDQLRARVAEMEADNAIRAECQKMLRETLAQTDTNLANLEAQVGEPDPLQHEALALLQQLPAQGWAEAIEDLARISEFWKNPPVPAAENPPGPSLQPRLGRGYTSTIPPLDSEDPCETEAPGEDGRAMSELVRQIANRVSPWMTSDNKSVIVAMDRILDEHREMSRAEDASIAIGTPQSLEPNKEDTQYDAAERDQFRARVAELENRSDLDTLRAMLVGIGFECKAIGLWPSGGTMIHAIWGEHTTSFFFNRQGKMVANPDA